jgi:hypothetical protein
MFMSIKGFISKKYNIMMDIPIDNISEIIPSKRHELEIRSNGKEYKIDTGELLAKTVHQAVNEVRKMVIVS